MQLNRDEARELMILAFRHALGRATFAPLTLSEIIKKNHKVLADFDKKQIIRDIERAIESKSAGMDCDVKTWKDLAEFLRSYK